MRVPDVSILPERTVLLPVSAVGYLLDYDDNRLEETERTQALERSIGEEVERQGRAKGARPVPIDGVTACGATCTSLLSTVIRWGQKAASEIAAQQRGIIDSGRSSVGQWQNGRDLRPLQRVMDADFALVSYVRDVHETPGREFAFASMNAAGRALRNRNQPQEAHRVLIACAMELASGRMVWCSSVDRWSMHDQYLDIKAPEEARRLVKEMLAGF